MGPFEKLYQIIVDFFKNLIPKIFELIEAIPYEYKPFIALGVMIGIYLIYSACEKFIPKFKKWLNKL